jgi:uncharacterized delta-60 repeat protein
MGVHCNDNGTWRKTTPYFKIGGDWKLPDYIWTKQGGEWYTGFVKGGLVDRSWDDVDQSPFGTAASGSVRSIAVQADGKILVVGAFGGWGGTTVNRIVRLNSDGTRDTAFTTNTGTAANNTVFSVALQADGKILVGGLFTTWNGVTVNRIVRLNSDGTRDTAFTTNAGAAANGGVFWIAVQADGKILLGGEFGIWASTTVNRIVRLNSDGTRDTAFTTNAGAAAGKDNVNSLAVQADGKILVGGAFTTWDGVTVNRIVRLNSDGTRDTAFTTNTGTAANSTVNSLVVQADGKILVGGAFTTWDGVTVNRIVRLNSDGTRDTAFTTNTGTAANSTINSLVVQADEKILVGGFFTAWDGVTVNRIVRLNSDGTRDTAFTTNTGTAANNTVFSIAVQADGKILIGGDFTTWNGVIVNRIVPLNSDGVLSISVFSSGVVRSLAVQADRKILIGGEFTTWNGVTVNRIVRLNSDGTRDTAFTTNAGTAANNAVRGALAVQADGKILVGGDFTAWDGTTVNRIVRLNSDGTRDTAFTTNTGTAANNLVFSVALQEDGKILVGGFFTAWDGTTVNRIVRLNSDGTRDTAFTTNAGTAANSNVNSIVVQADGKILVGGAFTTWDGTTVNRIVRLNSDGTRDTAFTTNTGTAANSTVNSLVVQADGKILAGGTFTTWDGVTVNYIVRLNSDGTRDTAFTTNAGTAANNTVDSVALQEDGKILVGGFFTTWGGTTVNRIVRLNSDGTRDTAFTTNAGTAANGSVNSLVVQADGKILLGGSFTIWNDIEFRRVFVRIGGEQAS